MENEFFPLLRLKPSRRWHQLGGLIATYPVNQDKLASRVPCEKVPIVSMGKKGNVKFISMGDIQKETVLAFPEGLYSELGRLLGYYLVDKKPYEGFLNHWNGDRCFGVGYRFHSLSSVESIKGAHQFSSLVFQKDFICSELAFLHPPDMQYSPLKQKIYRRNTCHDTIRIKSILEKAFNNPQLLSPSEISQLNQSNEWLYSLHRRMPQIYHFRGRYSSCFACAWEEINLDHPLSCYIIKILSKLVLAGLIGSENVTYWKIVRTNLDICRWHPK